MTKRSFFIGGILVLVLGLVIVPSVAAESYKSHVHAAITTLEAQYQRNLNGLPQSPTAAQAVTALQPFEQTRMPKLLALGSFAWAIPAYKQESGLETQTDTLVSEGAAYHQAFQQLVNFYNQTDVIIARETGANTTSASGWQATGNGYSNVAALRKQVVTSPLLASNTQQEVATLSKMSYYDGEEAAAVNSGDLAAQNAIKSDLTQLAESLSVLSTTDEPSGFSAWRSNLSGQFSRLIRASQ